MANRRQTDLSGGGMGADETGDWFPITVDKLLLTCYDADNFASAVVVEYDLSDDPDDVDPPVNFAPMKDSNGQTVQVGEKRSDIPLSFLPVGYRMRARTVGGDGNTNVITRINY